MAALANGNGYKTWIVGVAGSLLVAGVVAAIAQSNEVAEKAGATDARVSALERREPQREADHDKVVKLEGKLEEIDKKLDKIADALGVH